MSRSNNCSDQKIAHFPTVFMKDQLPSNVTIRRPDALIRGNDLFYMPLISQRYVFRCLFQQCHPATSDTRAMRTVASLPETGEKSNTWVPVIRTMYDPPNMGFWMYFAPDSGFEFNLGNSISFRGHADALRHFCPTQCRIINSEGRVVHSPEAIIAYRAKQECYDSVQFTRFVEHKTLKMEILFTRLNVINGSSARECSTYAERFRRAGSHRRNAVSCGAWRALKRFDAAVTPWGRTG